MTGDERRNKKLRQLVMAGSLMSWWINQSVEFDENHEARKLSKAWNDALDNIRESKRGTM